MSKSFITVSELMAMQFPEARIVDGVIRCEAKGCNKPAIGVDINPYHDKRIAGTCSDKHSIGGYPIELARLVPEWNDWMFHLAEKDATTHLVDLLNWLGRGGFRALGGKDG